MAEAKTFEGAIGIDQRVDSLTKNCRLALLLAGFEYAEPWHCRRQRSRQACPAARHRG